MAGKINKPNFYLSFYYCIWTGPSIQFVIKEIDELQKQIDKVLEGLFEPEFRFMSHITIARVKKVPDRKALVDYVKKCID